MIKQIAIIVRDAVILMASFFCCEGKVKIKKEGLSPLFYKCLTFMHRLEFLMLLKSMLLEEKVLI